MYGVQCNRSRHAAQSNEREEFEENRRPFAQSSGARVGRRGASEFGSPHSGQNRQSNPLLKHASAAKAKQIVRDVGGWAQHGQHRSGTRQTEQNRMQST